MFIGLLDAQGKAISPKVLARVPAESVKWSVEYAGENQIAFTNLTNLQMQVYEAIHRMVNKIAMFREVDDMIPSIPPRDVPGFTSLQKNAFMVIAPRGLQFTLSFSGGNEPDVGRMADAIDKLTDTALKHLHFIHNIAYTATGDLRVLARNYLKEHGGFDRVR